MLLGEFIEIMNIIRYESHVKCSYISVLNYKGPHYMGVIKFNEYIMYKQNLTTMRHNAYLSHFIIIPRNNTIILPGSVNSLLGTETKSNPTWITDDNELQVNMTITLNLIEELAITKLSLPYDEKTFSNEIILSNTPSILTEANNVYKEFYDKFYKRVTEQNVNINQVDKKAFRLILQIVCAEETIPNFNTISSDVQKNLLVSYLNNYIKLR